MSNFPFAWWDKTITVYNRVIDPTTQRISWYSTYITNCFWKCTNNTYNLGRYGLSALGVTLETKSVICRIPKDKRFVEPMEWETLSDKAGKFTLNNGDIIILGKVSDTIDEYTKGKHSTDLLTHYKKYDACLEVDTYVLNDYTGVDLAHYRIIGK